jgi:uncharacterized protein (DUF58 family)
VTRGNFAAVRTPERPGPGPTPEALLRALDLDVRRRVAGLLAGEYRSASPGTGTELSQVRPYEVGDDVRQLDPNVTARTSEPHVRVHVAEKVLTAWIALDTSPSMLFGTAARRKADVAEGVVLTLGHLATRGGNRVGIATFGDREPRTLPPRGGRQGTLGVLTTLRREPEPEGTGSTSPVEVLGRIGCLARRGAFVAVVSDFRGPRDWRRPLLQLAHRHDVVMVEIRDPREQELPDVGDLHLVDPETGRQLTVDTRDRRLRERFAAEAAREREELAGELRSAGVDHVVLSTGGDWLRTFAGFLRRRGGRR